MKLPFSDNILKHYPENMYVIHGHSYAGKSTMVRMLSALAKHFGLEE